MMVVLPHPLFPSKPNISFWCTSNDTSSIPAALNFLVNRLILTARCLSSYLIFFIPLLSFPINDSFYTIIRLTTRVARLMKKMLLKHSPTISQVYMLTNFW